MDINNELKLSEINYKGKKFIRREDLTPLKRFFIAFTGLMAQNCNIRGKITQLSREFMVSRMFVYILMKELEEANVRIFWNNITTYIVNKRLHLKYILSLRLEGRNSIDGISTIMQRFNIDNSSTGYISQTLQYFGSQLPNTLSMDNEKIKLVVYASDEVFSKKVPILITVDPISTAILRIELANTRKIDDWKKHWECLEENNILALYLVCDEGKGLCGAKEEALPDQIRQSDTYHAIAHHLGQWVKRLENDAYNSIEYADERYEKLDSAKSDKTINKRINQYEEAIRISAAKIELYDSYNYLYRGLIGELLLFDDNGNLRERKDAEENIIGWLSLMEELKVSHITKEIKKVRRTIPDMLNYFEIAKDIVNKLEHLSVDQDAIKALCIAWQWRKGMIKAKKTKARNYCCEREEWCLEIATGYLQDDYDHIKEYVYMELNKIVQSSAIVECINSIIRPYLNNSKNNIRQEMLNLIMFYHNHRRYKDGERKGKIPIEILTGKRQEKDWIELLFDVIEEKDPDFFISSR